MESSKKVNLPMDFGIEYLDSPAHENLRFLCQGYEELLANSAIMSFNSPVIKKMTIDIGRTTVDVQDFPKDVVRHFLEACYSGSFREISKSMFRDFNKIAHTFEVNWICEGCFIYFQSLLDTIDAGDYTSQLYLFNEAIYNWENLRNKKYIKAVIEKFKSLTKCAENFVTKFLKDISACSAKNLSVLLKMADESTLLRVLILGLRNEKSPLHPNIRMILEKLDFSDFFMRSESNIRLYRRLTKRLQEIENPSTEDYKLILKMFCPSKDQTRVLANLHHDRLGQLQLKYNRIALDELTTFLIASPLVKNFYIFFDAIEIWLSEKPKELSKTPIIDFDGYVKSLEKIVTKKRWQLLAQEYITSKDLPHMRGLIGKILSSHNLTTNENYIRVRSNLDYTPDELFGRNQNMQFKYERKCDKSLCIDKGDCGFILSSLIPRGPSFDDIFSIFLLNNPKLYPDDIHFHEHSVKAENLHFALDITNSDGKTMLNVPVTWHGEPCRDDTGKYWHWGPHNFYKEGEGLRNEFDKQFRNYNWHGRTSKIRPVVFIINN